MNGVSWFCAVACVRECVLCNMYISMYVYVTENIDLAVQTDSDDPIDWFG